MRLLALVLFLATTSFAAHQLHKRSNAYGDELIVPEEPATQPEAEVHAEPKQPGYAEEDVAVVAGEQSTAEELEQHPEVERSGYRFKRSNAYGDEMIVPEEGEEQKGEEEVQQAEEKTDEKPAYGEEEAEVVNAEPYGNIQTHPTLPVQESGYRHKRSARPQRANEYGDEQIVPEVTVDDTLVAQGRLVETEPVVAEVDQYEPVPKAAAEVKQVQKSGYRQKRNAYGDELIVPARLETSPSYGANAEVKEVSAPLVDQSYVGEVAAVRPAKPAVKVVSSKSVMYGDEEEVVAVPELSIHHLRYAEVPLTYGALFASRPYPKAPVVLASGYKRRAAKRVRFVRRRLH